jgi:hypothetical protein
MGLPAKQRNCRLHTEPAPAPKPRVVLRPDYDFPTLCASMKARKKVHLKHHDGSSVIGLINGIQLEDGSGKSWIVTMLKDNNQYEQVWIKTS